MAQEINFEANGDFGASRAAEKWLKENGYSVGSMQRGHPRGILKGDWDVAKWLGNEMKRYMEKSA